MTDRPIVHIGYHKTASTWFQRQFYPNVRNARYIPQLDVIRAFKRHNVLGGDKAALRQALGGSGTPHAIVCDETLCGAFRERHLQGVNTWAAAHVLADVMPDADIVIFLRAQPEMMAATYIEYVRSGGIKSPSAYFGLENNEIQSLQAAMSDKTDLSHFEYDRFLSIYDNLYSNNRIHVFLYEDFKENSFDFLVRFSSKLKFDVNLENIDMAAENKSYRSSTLYLARMMNHFGQGDNGYTVPINIPGFFRHSRRLLHHLNHIPSNGRPLTPTELFGPDMVAQLERRFAPSNQRLLAMRDLALAENGYPL